MSVIEQKISDLHEQLVPMYGKADTIAGEIIRAVSKIGYRFYNDGDALGIGYGNETCNPAGRYLIHRCGGRVAQVVRDMWGVRNVKIYMACLEELMSAVYEYLEQNPKLKETENRVDMFSYATDEDKNYYEDEDDWEEY